MTLNERVREVRKSTGLTLEKFAIRLGVTKAAISNIENGNRNVSEQLIKSICREYSVDETWLRTGNGDKMFMLELDEDTMLVESLLNDVDNPVYELIKKFMKLYNSFGPTERAVLEKLALGLLEEQNNKKSENDN
jgi:transcriptional regulator with XRE-family HTH domain